MQSRILHRSTGAKGVKLQRSPSAVQKRRKDGPRCRKRPASPADCRPVWAVEKPYEHSCKICGDRYKRLEHCRRHEQTSHFPVMKSRCEICGKEFPRNDNCIQHYKTHIRFADKKKPRGNENRKYTVEECLLLVQDEKARTKIRQFGLEGSSG
ncbi:uncharacterized protein EI97DRAFT_375628 [Westerdykella ornata]|uniref:C2H2-type domain-containing protein n=1 Tax=Westerdykella ornata TaxID=318751 RepID=A0A6A6JLX4_WESOR|nr:uncharacterized protein EI97DRAFT_375628 [Westerdykella ornata]KAF2277235.1 hypothetical protein EI97DRAFT_375628 [Westerdykella ornata]